MSSSVVATIMPYKCVIRGGAHSSSQKRTLVQREQLVLWAVKTVDSERVNVIIDTESLRLYSVTYALLEEDLAGQEEVFLRESMGQCYHQDGWDIRRIDKMHVKRVTWNDDASVLTVSGIEVTADARDVIEYLAQVKRTALLVVKVVASEETAILGFMRRQGVHPYSWWNVVADTVECSEDGKLWTLRDPATSFFAQNSRCLPSRLHDAIRVHGVRELRERGDHCITIVMGGLSRGAQESDYGWCKVTLRRDNLSEERVAIRQLQDYLDRNSVDVLAGENVAETLGRLQARCREHAARTGEACTLDPGERLLLVDIGRAIRKASGVLSYASTMGVSRREFSANLTPTQRVLAESDLLFNALRQRRSVFVEMFMHGVVHKLMGRHLLLTVGEYQIDGVLALARHAYEQHGENATPPQYFVECRTAAECAARTGGSEVLPGGYNIPPCAGLHDAEVVALDFRAFYPSCITSYNIGKGLVEIGSRPAAESVGWQSLVPLHIGDTSSDVCDCCKRPTYRHDTATVLHQLRLGQRHMRIWQDTCDERIVRVRVCSDMISPASELLRNLLHRREEMKISGDNNAELVCKTLCNSVFGMFGYRGMRGRLNKFYDPACYIAIVQLGRSHLLRAAIALDKMNAGVVYGDTDSLFVTRTLGFQGDRFDECALQRVNDQVSVCEARAALLTTANEHAVRLHVAHRYTGMVIFSKKKYIAKESDDSTLRRVGFPKRPKYRENIQSLFVDFCVRFCFEHRKVDNRAIPSALHAINAFLLHFDVEKTSRESWFFTKDRENAHLQIRDAACNEIVRLDAAVESAVSTKMDVEHAVWDTIDKEMRDRLCPLLFVDTEWIKVNATARSMVRNHYQFRWKMLRTRSQRQAELSVANTQQDFVHCCKCRRVEVTQEDSDLNETRTAQVTARVKECADHGCDYWY
eukprot:gene112-162_t